jgi:hypothetical protein
MYKALNDEDIIVGTFPIVEPAGADEGGLLVEDTDYAVLQGNKSNADNTATKKRYLQLANIIQGDSTTNLPIGSSFHAVTLYRNSFKEAISPRTFTIADIGIDTGSLTFTEAGRQFKATNSSYYLYPDIGIALCSGTPGTVKGCSEETTTFTNIFVRVDPSEFNYSQNPSFSDIENYIRFPDWVDNPKTFITTIGFYNDNGDCVAVAKLDQPRENSFEKALLFRIELKY